MALKSATRFVSALRFRLKQAGSVPAEDASAPMQVDEDAIREAGVLRDVLELHPTHLTESELIRRKGVDPSGAFELVDPWEIAIRELRRTGLLQPHGPVVAPTISALRFSELFETP